MATKATVSLPSTTFPSPTTMLVANSTFNNSLAASWSKYNAGFWKATFLAIHVTSSLEAITVIATNLLVLFVIVSSSLMRSRMRNQLVISVVVANLLVGLLSAPFTLDASLRMGWVHGCYVQVILTLLCAYVQNFVSMWGTVGLVLHYLARLVRYEGPQWLGRLPPRVQRAVPALLIASPWIISVVLLIPLVFGGMKRHVWAVWSYTTCPIVLYKWATLFLNTLSFIIPALLLTALIVAILLLRHRREVKGDSPHGMETGLAVVSSTGPELEACWVHVLVALLTILMMGPQHVFMMIRYSRVGPWRHVVIASVAVYLLSDLAPFVVALLWLLMLPDVRGRVGELAARLFHYLFRCRTRSPPQAPGTTSVAPMTFTDLQDE